MTVNALAGIRPIQWSDRGLTLLDQTLLPGQERWLCADRVDAIAEAIQSMRVRGAPALGIAGAAGIAVAARDAARSGVGQRDAQESAATMLLRTRPTAVNLRRGVERARQVAQRAGTPDEVVGALDRLVARLLEDQWAVDRAMSAIGAALLPVGARVLTHCNTGPLATGGYGTALGVIRAANERGMLELVYACEARPALQGARLTAWELGRLGIPFQLIPDAAAAAIMAREPIDAVLVGADRIAANGDTANKIGTYQLAVAASYHRIPFYVVAPRSTIDPATADGSEIPIEERSPDEVHTFGGVRVTPAGTSALNLAFDVTPASLITGIITEKGVLRPPFEVAIGAVVSSGDRPGAVTDMPAEDVGTTEPRV